MSFFQMDVTVAVPVIQQLGAFVAGILGAHAVLLDRPAFFLLSALALVAQFLLAKALYAVAEKNYFEDAISELMKPERGDNPSALF